MANTILTFKKYIDQLDDVYKLSSKTAVLETNPALITQGANAGEFVIPKLDMDGLGDYSRNDGYVSGGVDLKNETVKCDFDRGRRFTVDAMDNEETAGVAFGRLAAEFIRTKVTPELDAYRFAKYALKAGTKKAAALADGVAVMQAITAAIGKILPKLNEGTLGKLLFEPPFLLPPPNFFNRLLNTSSISGGDCS